MAPCAFAACVRARRRVLTLRRRLKNPLRVASLKSRYDEDERQARICSISQPPLRAGA